MALPNVFDTQVSENIIDRINLLTPQTQAQWGKMSVAQMLAHCNVTYEMANEEPQHEKATGFKKLMLTWFVKPMVVTEKVYGKNGRTAPAFIISDERDFNIEKNRLISFVQKTQKLGTSHFDGRESLSFGKLNSTEWNNMFYKHLNHHLSQFGV